MDLVERIKKIAETEGVPESELILDEIRFFNESHAEHGSGIQVRLSYSGGILECIGLYCEATEIVNREECPHNNWRSEDGGGDSIIYFNQKSRPYMRDEVSRQKERRMFYDQLHRDLKQ